MLVLLVHMTANGVALRPQRLVHASQPPVTLTILGKVVTSRATFEREAKDIYGTVWEDGTFGATIGFQHLTGNFIEGRFEGTFNSFGCAWKMILKIKKPR
jgi:hypothetical protein